ncbi:3-hydroxybutyryl-CoA dehydrogenase [Mycolicibacterium sp. CBMA 361]|uniref:3-hydroxybutyryl-CoA dehydrogenase n=1 Tax=Mycolicibacterium sp. CBMA 361 TaxID=2606610 RepID=UPI0013968412|nr:3-hydroxybutyryl-CoA dehydrogenase [Mycolicibacterium sp. CBMA 361]
MSNAIERVGVIGAGQMGGGIAEVCIKAGAQVLAFEPTEALTTAGRERITKSLDKAVNKGKLSEADRDAALGRLSFTNDLADMADRQLVIEAIVEDVNVKAKVFAQLDEVITDPDAVLASNTSSIPIMRIAAATKNPSRVLGLHFFNPVPVLPLVELISSVTTSGEAAARVEAFAGEVLGKKVVRAADRSGFVVNFLLVPYLLAAIRMAESGFATVEDIDTAVVAGVEAGQLGKKSGKGFYTYS